MAKILCVLVLLVLMVLFVPAGAIPDGIPQGHPALDDAGISSSRSPTDDSQAVDGVIISLHRVADIAHGVFSSDPMYLTRYNGDLYFSADGNDSAGRELWKFNTTHGPRRVLDISPGTSSSFPSYLTVYNNALFFAANANDGTNNELWRYDPVYGLQQAANINNAGGSNPAYLAVFGDWLYFSANGNNGNGTELWRYNPTYHAQPVADIFPGTSGSNPAYLTVYNGALYFSANGNDGAGRELWKYDPVHGASRVEDISPGVLSSDPAFLTVYNGALYFSASGNDEAGRELWEYDPANGAQRVADIFIGTAGSNPTHLAVYNGALYFGANGDDGAGGELWKYEPVNGADRVADIYPGPGTSMFWYPAVYNGALYFNANGNDGGGYELWRYSNSVTSSFRSIKGQDGWVLESGENTNAGGTVNAGAVTFNLGDDAANRQYRAVLSFDTSTLPDSAVVTSAALKIRREGLVGTSPFTTHGALRADIRKGPFSGNATLQAADFQAPATRSDAGTITNSPDPNNVYSGTLLGTSYGGVNKTGLTQVRLRFATDDNNDNGADYLRFFSGNAVTVSDRPQLLVTYYIP